MVSPILGVVMVSPIVGVVNKLLLRVAVIMKMLVTVEVSGIDVRSDVASDTLANLGIIVLAAGVILLEFAVTVTYSVGVMSGVVADALLNMLTGTIIGCVSDIGVEVLADVNANVFAAVITTLEFAVPMPSEECWCCLPFDCWSRTAFNCNRVLQVCMPSYHVCRGCALPALPQFLNQEPPRPQQFLLPDFLMVPHLVHTELMVVVVVTAVIYM